MRDVALELLVGDHERRREHHQRGRATPIADPLEDRRERGVGPVARFCVGQCSTPDLDGSCPPIVTM